MSTFQFEISPADIKVIKNLASNPASSVIVRPDRGFTRKSKHNILRANFGDGYEQRVIGGINPRNDSFNVSFSNRPAEEIHLIAGFLDLKQAISFDLKISDTFNSNGDGTMTFTTFKVTCEEYSISYIQPTVQALNATFKRVYEP